MIFKGLFMFRFIFLSLFVALFSACSVKTTTKIDTVIVPEDIITQSSKEKLAIIIPEKVLRSYTKIIVNSALAYNLRQESNLHVEVFLIGTEDERTIIQKLRQIESLGYRFAIAAFTLKGLNALEKADTNMYFYIPTIHKNFTNTSNDKIYFGSIDYKNQLSTLLKISNSSNIASFYDNSALSTSLNSSLLEQVPNARTYKIEDKKINFKNILFSKGSLNGANIFLNTPIVESAIISSQLRVHKTNANKLLATQIGYNPTLLSLTQINDRANLYIANSISNDDKALSYLNELLEQSIDYNWVAYASSVGIDFFYTNFMNTSAKSLFDEKIEDNQVVYDVKIMRALGLGFSEN